MNRINSAVHALGKTACTMGVATSLALSPLHVAAAGQPPQDSAQKTAPAATQPSPQPKTAKQPPQDSAPTTAAQPNAQPQSEAAPSPESAPRRPTPDTTKQDKAPTPSPAPPANEDGSPLTAAQQGQAQIQGPGQATQSMEGVAVDPKLLRKPLNRVQIAGWTTLLTSLALGAGASALVNGAQTAEGSAQRLLRRFDDASGAHPVYGEVRQAYNNHLDRAATMRSTALALSLTAGVAFLTGVTLAIVGASQRKRTEPRVRGLSLRF